MQHNNDNIVALATPQGSGAIGVIRLSGKDVIDVLDKLFVPFGCNFNSIPDNKRLASKDGYKMFFGSIYREGKVLDECMVAIFRAPHSYTGENSAEIYCHGSSYILNEVIKSLIDSGNIRLAEPGEFSKRAFLNGKMDLAQAEAVADLIASETEAAHRVAMQQMRGSFSSELKEMREELLHLVSLMELELDFSEEDVEFADRSELKGLVSKVLDKVTSLTESFSLGNVIKNGVPVAIVGATNTGKSTLLNSLLGEEKAIVSNIHGTTRDVVEDTINLNGVTFRFTDTAGIRETKETIEMIGIERTYLKLKQASVVIMVLDATRPEYFDDSLINLAPRLNKAKQKLIIALNKCDMHNNSQISEMINNIQELCKKAHLSPIAILPISAKGNIGINELKDLLVSTQQGRTVDQNSTLVTNLRHYEALLDAQRALDRVEDGLRDSIPTDLVSQDIREAMYHLGSIVGEINTEEILGSIFSKFCIGK